MKEKDAYTQKSKRVNPWLYFAVLFVNVIAFVCIGAAYMNSESHYSQRIFDENVKNTENLNIASANAAYNYTNGMGVKLNDMISYIESNGLTYEQATAYLRACNTDPDRQIQLILSGKYGSSGNLSFGDYSGISIRKLKTNGGKLESLEREISYSNGYYDILQAFTDVNDATYIGTCFTPEFTDPDTKKKVFAVYAHTVLTDSSGEKRLYTLLLAVDSQIALDAYNVQNKYKGQSTVIVNADGDYIVKSSDYRNANFFDYIVNYNGLTLDWKDRLKAQLTTQTPSAAGTPVNLFYKNHSGDACVFSVAATDNGWYSITCVPLSSFSSEDNTVNYSRIILMLFVILFLIDGVAIYFVGKTMSYNVAVAEKATEDANEANRAKSRFLSTMSHELRTPLNAVIGLVSLSGDNIDKPAVLKDYLKKIDISSKLLLQLISDILDVSAIESNKMKLNSTEFDITRLISSLSAIYYDQCAAKGIEFNVSLKNMHSEILIGDSVRVNQVLLNFLSNAVKYTPNGGKVTLCAEQVKKENSSVVIRFTVTDTGCGISEDLRTRLFMPFERENGESSRKHSGSGLGLSIAKNLIELMHGEVGVTSTEGAGSSFYAEIPFTLPSDISHQSFSPITNIRVLAAISNDDERDYISQILTQFGLEHYMVSNAAQALELLKEKRSTDKAFNLCIFDWKMSDLNGLDATRKIREEYSKETLRIIILAYDLAKANTLYTDAGADLVFGKPVFPSALYNTLEETASGKTVRPVPGSTKSYDMTGKRILLVEDNSLNTEIAEQMLQKVGIIVETAENGKEGYERFLSSPNGYFDAILMDVQMPVMDGYRSTREIRASRHPQGKTIPVLAMTADAFAEDVEKATNAGMDAHISKPVEPNNLFSILKKYLGKSE